MAKAKSTKQLLVELMNLSETVSPSIYRMIQIAAAVFGDAAWIAEEHGGSSDAAREWLEKRYFGFLGGVLSLEKLIAVYESFPDESSWQEYRYDLRSMCDLHDQAVNDDAGCDVKPERTKWKAEAARLAEEVIQLNRQLGEAKAALQDARSEIAQLKKIVDELRIANARMEGRLESMATA